MNLKKRFERFVLSITTKNMIEQGYHQTAARMWVRSQYQDWLLYIKGMFSEVSFADIRKAHKAGFDVLSWKSTQGLKLKGGLLLVSIFSCTLTTQMKHGSLIGEMHTQYFATQNWIRLFTIVA